MMGGEDSVSNQTGVFSNERSGPSLLEMKADMLFPSSGVARESSVFRAARLARELAPSSTGAPEHRITIGHRSTVGHQPTFDPNWTMACCWTRAECEANSGGSGGRRRGGVGGAVWLGLDPRQRRRRRYSWPLNRY